MAALLALQFLLPSAISAAVPPADENSTLPECCRPRVAQPARLFLIHFRGPAGDEATALLDPVFTAAADAFTSSPVLFLTFDLSTPRTIRQAEYLAKAAGLESVWNSFSKASGFLILADGETRQYRLKLTRFDTSESVRAAIEKALAAPPAVGLAKQD